jgi:hypothetical protein
MPNPSLTTQFSQFSPRDFFSLDDWVFNTEAHPLHIPKKGTSVQDLPTSLWSGPEASSTPTDSFVQVGKDGTWVQQWARIRQAAGLLRLIKEDMAAVAAKDNSQQPEADVLRADVAVRPFVRPSEDELKAAGAKPEDLAQAGFAKAPERPKNVFGGGGRGMGRGGHPEARPVIPA